MPGPGASSSTRIHNSDRCEIRSRPRCVHAHGARHCATGWKRHDASGAHRRRKRDESLAAVSPRLNLVSNLVTARNAGHMRSAFDRIVSLALIRVPVTCGALLRPTSRDRPAREVWHPRGEVRTADTARFGSRHRAPDSRRSSSVAYHPCDRIERTAHRPTTDLEHVGVDHGRGDI